MPVIALTIIQILQVLLDVVRWIILIQFVMSLLIAFNVINMSNQFLRSLFAGLEKLTEPLYRPIRRLLPDTGGIDFAPMIVLVAIMILDSIILTNIAKSIQFGGAV